MQKNKILALCVLLLVITAMFSLPFLPRGRTPITFDGKYLGQNEDYMQLRYGSKLIHINIRNHPELPKFYRGDTIEVQYYRSRKNSYGSDGSRYFEEILSINEDLPWIGVFLWNLPRQLLPVYCYPWVWTATFSEGWKFPHTAWMCPLRTSGSR